MCGFIGILKNKNNFIYKKIINNSLKYLHHRGPDSKGTYEDNNIALGFQRLSIQDISKKGNQPMISQNQNYLIVYNGEIYNFLELKKKLIAKNYLFKSNTDTEVLLNLYIEYGPKCLNFLEGMFAFCIYNKKQKSIFLARDQFGTKPIYYTRTKSNNLLFGSEFKAFVPFIKTENLSWSLNEKKLNEQISFRSLAGKETLIKNIFKLMPGEFIFAQKSKFYKKKYFSISTFEKTQNLKFSSKIEVIDQTERYLYQTIQKNLISDVPTGIALSGGLDSSLITAFSSKFIQKINTFSINFDQKKNKNSIIDENYYIKYIKSKYNTFHHSAILTEKFYKNNFFKCVWHNDEPISFPHSPGIFLLSKLAKENNIKVLLGGEGADEIFGGYDDFISNKLNLYFYRISSFNKKNGLFNINDYDLKERSNYIINSNGNMNIKKIKYSLNTYLQSIQNRLDKMSMANGVEFRVPFIDKNLLKLSISNQKYGIVQNKKISKYLLKIIGEKYFKKKHIYRPKVGFSTPINFWMRNKKGFGEILDILIDSKTTNREIYNQKNLKKLIIDFYKYPNENYKNSNAGKIWNILNLELWIRSFIESKSELK